MTWQAPPTAKGHRFLGMEDEAGMINVIWRPQTYERSRSILRSTALLLVEGTVQSRNGVTNVIATRAAALRNIIQ